MTDLIAIGTLSVNGLGYLLLGSVARGLMRCLGGAPNMPGFVDEVARVYPGQLYSCQERKFADKYGVTKKVVKWIR